MKLRKIGFLCLALCILLSGCKIQGGEENKMHVYYINADGNALLQDDCPKMNVEKAWEKIQELSVLPQNIELQGHQLLDGQLLLYFHKNYTELKATTEVLLRAAIVQTMVQIEGVQFVSIFVDNSPLTDTDGNIVGLMRGEDFVQNTGSSISSYQTTDLKLYFANKDGKLLKESNKTNIRYNSNTSIEKLVVEQLMKGTNASGLQPTIPKATKLLGVSVKDGICYVNFDSKFLQDSYDLHPEVAVYSIVNSIVMNGSVLKVQILVEGASDVVYKNSVDLSRPLELKKDLIEE